MRAWLFRLILIFAAAAPAGGRAEEGGRFPLRISVGDDSHLSRTCGPVRLELVFDWGGPGVFNGGLVLDVRDSERILLGTFLIENLFLSPGQQVQEVMLPGFRAYSVNDELTLGASVLDAKGKTLADLPPMLLRIPGAHQRSLVIANCRADTGQNRRIDHDYINALRLEALSPRYQRQRPQAPIVTRSTFVAPEEAPAEPLRWCAVDIVLLSGDGLALLHPAQLDALLAWVRAGGAMCLIIDEAPLDSAQVAFVEALAAAAPGEIFLADRTRRLVYGAAETPERPLYFTTGLGRTVIVGWNDDLLRADAAHWPGTAAHLWRLRAEHQAAIAETGLWDYDRTIKTLRRYSQETQSPYGNPQEAIDSQASDAAPVATSGGLGLLTSMLPPGLQMVPVWMIGGILLGYLLAIGPLDYLFLGKLRLRRWTWVTFPLITIGFTVFSVMVSNAYLRTADRRGRIAVRDLDGTGQVLRENRLELLFLSSSRLATTEVGRGLFIPLRVNDFVPFQYGYDPRNPTIFGKTRAGPALFRGRMPGQCTATQMVPQWTPQLNREFTIPAAASAPAAGNFDWSELPLRDGAADMAALRSRVLESFGSQARAWLYHGREASTLLGTGNLFPEEPSMSFAATGQFINRKCDFLRDLCVPDQPGFFGIVSQYSPTGGDRFEDLALLDPTDPRQWLLVVAVPGDDGLELYRRLYVLEN